MKALLEYVFHIEERNSSVWGEALGGLNHFFGNAFNLVATARVLSVGGIRFEDAVSAGAWTGFISQVLCGLLGNLPISVSAGQGPNLTVAYLLAQPTRKGGLGSYSAAMTVCFVSGIAMALLVKFGAVSALTVIVPTSLKLAMCVGIGLLCAFIGFQQVQLVVQNEEGLIGPGDFSGNPEIWFSLGGLLVLTLLQERKMKGSVLLVMISLAVIDFSFIRGWPQLQFSTFSLPVVYAPDLSLMLESNFWVQVVAMVMMLTFDAMGCIFGLAKLAGRMDSSSGKVEGGDGMFYGIGLGTAAAALCGMSPIVISGGSAAAIVDGARTGLSTCISGILCLLTLPLANVIASMPECTTSFVLIYVGVSLSADAAHIEWGDPIIAVPSFLCIICQPFLFSIADGIFMGLGSALLLYLFSGRMFAKPEASMIPENSPSPGLTRNRSLSSIADAIKGGGIRETDDDFTQKKGIEMFYAGVPESPGSPMRIRLRANDYGQTP